ncbi:MAG: hypothetical protein NXI24_15480 [bacterium]|nr:hypothetical protein [bacterium]
MSSFDFETLFPIAVIAGVIFIFAVIILMSLRRSARNKQKIAAIAAKLGLEFQDAGSFLRSRSGRDQLLQLQPGAQEDPAAARRQMRAVEQSGLARMAFEILSGFGPWELKGEYQDCETRVWPVEHGSAKSKRTYTRFEMNFAEPLDLELSITKEGMLDRIGKSVFGAQDITIAPENATGTRSEQAQSFDKIARVQCRADSEAVGPSAPENRVRSLLQNAGLQQAIIELLTDYPDASIGDLGLSFEIRGTLTDEKKYRAVLDRFAACMRAFRGDAFTRN